MTLLCTFSTVYGMRCGLKHVKLDWENESEVVKRGPAANFYMMPNMFGTMILIGVAIFLATRFDMRLIMLGVFVLYLLLTIVSYASLRKYVAKA
jgi:ABC-2 type transport system permease protein